MKIKILSIWLVLTAAVFAQTGMDGYRQPLTYHHNFAVDSAQALMKYVIVATPHTDTVSLSPLSGTSNQDLLEANMTNLNYIGGYLVVIEIYDGGSIIDTFLTTYLNLPDTSKFGSATASIPDSVTARIDSTLTSVGPDLVSDVSFIKGYTDTEIATLIDWLDSLRLAVGWPGVTPVWDTVTDNLHNKLGAYTGLVGSNVEDDFDSTIADIAAIVSASGDGPYLCSLLVRSSTGAMTSGTSSMTSGATRWTCNINGAGWIKYGLSAATWSALVYVPGYKQDTIPQTFVITAAKRDTITMSAITLAAPTDPAKVRVYAWTDNILGDTLEGAIMTAIPLVKGSLPWVAANNRILLPKQEVTTADDSGYVYLDLYPTETTNNSKGDSLYYNIELSKQGYPTAEFKKFRVYNDSTGSTQAVQAQ